MGSAIPSSIITVYEGTLATLALALPLSLTLSLVVPALKVSKNYNSDTCIDQEYI